MTRKNFVYKGKKYVAFSKTELCRRLGLSPHAKNMSQIQSSEIRQPSSTPKKKSKYLYRSPYAKSGVTPLGQKKQRNPRNKSNELPTLEEINRKLDKQFDGFKFNPYE